MITELIAYAERADREREERIAEIRGKASITFADDQARRALWTGVFMASLVPDPNLAYKMADNAVIAFDRRFV